MSANTFLAPSPVAPPFLVVSDITQASFAVVTVTTSNGYVIGQILHFSVPPGYGMLQIDQLTATIIEVDPTNLIFTTDINTTNFNPFIFPSTVQKPATVASGGSKNIYNISYVPFHSINGTIGN